MFLIAVLTAIAGEFKYIPFEGEAFRFGLGSAAFFFLLLIRKPDSYFQTALVTGMTVLLFRTAEDALLVSLPFISSLRIHFPAVLFYVLYGVGLGWIKIEKCKSTPLTLGAIATGMEFFANMAEQYFRKTVMLDSVSDMEEWYIFLVVAIFRSYFVVGLLSSLTVIDQQKRMEQMLKIGSSLYGETLYLKKSMDHIEQIMASSYDLYRKLKDTENRNWTRQALSIAQEIHEVKKDSQRILAGLTKVYDPEMSAYLKLSEILDFVVKGNEKYSQMLNKNVSFQLSMSMDEETTQYIPLLTILNNLTANAVEAIDGTGTIEIRVGKDLEAIFFEIKDSGKGIPEQDLDLIFEPGFTTKYNDKGVAATGIGLSHVKEIIDTLDGEMGVHSSSQGTVFLVRIPTKKLRSGTR